MNIQQMMQQAQKMQEQMQSELGDLVVEASAGGGMVAVKMSGHKQLLSATIDRDAIDPEDPAMLQDLVVAAVNEAARKVDEALQSKVGGLASALSGFGL